MPDSIFDYKVEDDDELDEEELEEQIEELEVERKKKTLLLYVNSSGTVVKLNINHSS